MFLFVYGTLKQGQRNEPILANGSYLCPGYTKEKEFRLHETTGYNYPFPALVRVDAGYRVFGEVHDANEKMIHTLDRLEGVDSGLYKRDEIIVVGVNGVEYPSIAYLYCRDVSQFPDTGPCWPSHELARWQLKGYRLQFEDGEIELQGVRLWNKSTEQWQSPCFFDERALRLWAAPKCIALGGGHGTEPWLESTFEVKPDTFTTQGKTVQLWNTETNLPISEPHESPQSLAEWMAANVQGFGGDTFSVGEWKKLFKLLAE